MEPRITVNLNLYSSTSSKLKAFADVTLGLASGELTIKGFKVVATKPDVLWVAPPCLSYEKDGQKHNKTVIEVSKTLEKMIAQAVLQEYRVALQGGL
jgi:DNA-binding cell septation regulator SpoVG